jgi:pyruvate kinase
MTNVGKKNPLEQFNAVLREAKRDTLISARQGEDAKIINAADRAIEYANLKGNPEARQQVLDQLAHLAELDAVHIEPLARTTIAEALNRLSANETVSKNTEDVLGPRPKGRRTYVMSTIGYTSQHKDVLKEMFKGGLNIVRLNMAHKGPHTDEYIATAREAAKEVGVPFRFIADLGGPKIRLGQWDKQAIGALQLEAGKPVTLQFDTTGKLAANPQLLPVDDPALLQSVAVGHRLMLVDGKIELKVTGKSDGKIEAEVIRGGEVAPGKGISLPDSHYVGDTITPEDVQALKYCCEQGIEMVGISFCSSAADVEKARALAASFGRPDIKLIAKIENRVGMENLEEITRAADGLMVARGDLGSELKQSEVPLAQREINRMGNVLGKPVIVATEVLGSMQQSARPLRAEVDGIFHALEQGAECLMTAKETTRGDHPGLVVRTLDEILKDHEKALGTGPLAVRMRSTAKAKPAPGPDVTAKLGERGATVTGQCYGIVVKDDAGKEYLSVKTPEGVLHFAVKEAQGQRFSRDETLYIKDATFTTSASLETRKATLVDDETGKKKATDIVLAGTAVVRSWMT